MSEYHLIVKELTKNYGKVEALKRADFSVKKGTITTFLGENGAGKTTAIKCTLGFLKRDSGTVELSAGRMGYVPEYPVFFSWLRGREILSYTLMVYGIQAEVREELVEEYSEKIGFDPQLLLRRVHTYSLGNRKKFSYLQTLLISPLFLIVDEPFYSLDPVSIKKIRELFLELKAKGVSLLLSSHLISEVEKITDDIIIIKRGSVIIQENLRRLTENFKFFQLKKYDAEMNQLLRFSPHVKELDTHFELLIEKRNLESFTSFLASREKSENGEDLNLEKIFLFFTR